jgi:hypothetical protein
MDLQISALIGAISGVFLVITLYNMLKGKLFWIADLGLDLGFTLVAPLVLGAGTASGAVSAMAFGVAFTVTLRIAHMFMPGQYLKFVIEKGWPRLRWIDVPPKKIELPRFGRRAW